MFTALVETFGTKLKVDDKEIGEYLRESDFDMQSPSLPFKNIEPRTHLIIISQKQDTNTENDICLGYWIANADVPAVPTIFVGKQNCIPTQMRRSLRNLFCVKKKDLEDILKPFLAAFTNSKKLLELAVHAKLDARVKVREELITKIIKHMKEQRYNIEEYKERL